ncbi:bifunctional non-homologous end joining protein LigD [Alicyclobacillus sacchari]|uniref:DNA ligase (ATP) n=1 Tax=Alicyclobacillus sacchari TaxID=392010 RepID=A0A4R8LVA0_9BACL|nr:DNA ligase [Alicyclobacillus sacchari]TDY50697.1 bifunctional non-homologous end joining protein LigD [Alicyclobacillus sacchari]GMA55677.1 hypothetical protein GCM10025858_01800 [Alicyclobacillus sacchari]
MKLFRPFEPVQTDELPTGTNWIGQVKWDGVRIVAHARDGAVNLVNRHGRSRNQAYPELAAALAPLVRQDCVLDGEVVAFAGGKPSFYHVLRRDRARRPADVDALRRQLPIVYMVFDIVWARGRPLHHLPLADRQERLRTLLEENDLVRLVASERALESLWIAVCEMGMEGIVVKDVTSTYEFGGKDKRWQKRKHRRNAAAVICGVTMKDGRSSALLLGLHDERGRLHYIGRAGPGALGTRQWGELVHKALAHPSAHCPCTVLPSRIPRDIIWTLPIIPVKVSFLEWTPDGTLRQPLLEGVLEIDPGMCTIDAADQ